MGKKLKKAKVKLQKKVQAKKPETVAPAAAPPAAPQEVGAVKHHSSNAGLSEQQLQEKYAPVGTATSKEELKRLDDLGLKEVEVFGTQLKLVAQKNPDKAPATTAQRLEMAKRLNEVGPLLPKYVPLIDAEKPVASVEKVLAAARTVPKKDNAEKKPGKATTSATEKVADKAAKKKPPAAKKETAEKKILGGIGGLVCKLLKGGKSTEDILEAVKKEFPKAHASPASVAWYRSQMRQEGK